MMFAAPQVAAGYSDLPKESEERPEFELQLLGQHLFFLRNRRMASITRLVEDEERRQRLGTIQRDVYDAVAHLEGTARNAAVKLAQAAIDLYMQDLLTLLASTGSSLRLGNSHAIRYKLAMEVIDQEQNVLHEDLINRGRAKHLPDYFGKWLNLYKGWGCPDAETSSLNLEP